MLGDGGNASTESYCEIDPAVRQLMDWLQNFTNRMLLIRKLEDGDRDLVWIQLDEVGYQPDRRSIDGYTDGPVIVLHGIGAVMSGTGEKPLPGDRYEISVAGAQVPQVEADNVLIQSDRARYEVLPLHTVRR